LVLSLTLGGTGIHAQNAVPGESTSEVDVQAIIADAHYALDVEPQTITEPVLDDDGAIRAPLGVSADLSEAAGAEGPEAALDAPLDVELEQDVPVHVVQAEDALDLVSASTGIVLPTGVENIAVLDDGTAVVKRTDTTLAVQTHEDGSVRAHNIIDGPDAAHRFEFPLALPDGVHARIAEDGGVDVFETVQDDNGPTSVMTGRVEAPWAVDVNGDRVPTHFELEGQTLYQVVQPVEAVAYPVVSDPFWIPAIVVGLRVGAQVLLKVGSRTVKYTKAPASRVVNALSSFRTLSFRAGSHTFKLDKSAMKHILSRHHPKYWDGTVKTNQSFFNANMSVNDVRNLIHAAMKQKASTLRSKGANTRISVSGTVNGVSYQMVISNGRVVQFYPR
jgi:hypothetical protein